jgi:uncharacterized protein
LKRSRLLYFLIPIILIVGYFVISHALPKYAGQYVVFVILVLADLYLWSSVKKQVFNYRIWLSILLSALYWLPFAALIGFGIAASIVPIINWNDVFRTYLLGFILIFYAAKLFPVIFIFLSDIIVVIDRIFVLFKKEKRREIGEKDSNGMTRSKFLVYMGYISGGLMLGTLLTGMFKWVYQFNVVKKKMKLSGLPSAFNGMKVVQISDLHLGSWASERPLEHAVEMVNNLNPDLILFTGDLVNFATKEAYRFEDTLRKLKSKEGILCILGNHDYGDYVSWPSRQAKRDNMKDLFDFYRRLGWDLLRNENRIFERNNGKLALLGVENWGASPRFPKYGDIDKTIKGTEDADVRILMSHDPTHWEKIIQPGDYDIALSLSGHTHGFQFGIETPGLKWSPAKWMYKYWAGLYADPASKRKLYVNRGLGVIGYPGRVGILPEITQFELTA